MCSLSDYAAIIQAGCAVLGTIGLIIYAYDTREIRKTMIAQTNAGRRPFPMLSGLTMENKRLVMKNAGTGIAMNIAWSFAFGDRKDAPERMGSLPPNDKRQLTKSGAMVSFTELIEARAIRVAYSDTAGNQYWTIFTPKRNGATYVVVTDTGEGTQTLSQ